MSDPDASLDYLRPRRLGVWVGLALLIAGAGALVFDRVRAANQPVWVVNGADAPLVLAVDGGAPHTLEPGGTLELTLGSGEHTATFSGALEGQETLSLAPTLAERWRGRAVYLLNPGGLGAVAWEVARYGPDVSGEAAPPRLLSLEPWQRVPDVDLLGVPFPETTSGRRLTRLVLLPGSPEDVVARLGQALEAEVALAFLEAHLARPGGGGAALLDAYRRLAQLHQAGERLRATLAGGLEPGSSLARHRAYQDLELSVGEGEALRARYQAWRDAHPDDARLVYLAGRLEPDATAAEAAYRRALELDPDLALAHHGLAYVLLARGAAAEAVGPATRACELAPRDPELAEVRFLARLGAGQAAELLGEGGTDPLRERRDDLDPGFERRLLELQALLDPTALPLALEAYRQSVGDADPRLALARATVAELQGDGAALVIASGALDGLRARRFRLLGLALAQDLSALFAALQGEADPWPGLEASVAAGRAGDPRAAAWRQAAAERFREAGPKGAALARGLEQSPADVDRLPLPLRQGALYCAALVQAFPQEGARLRAAGRRRLLGALAPVALARPVLTDE
ncbi:MAG: hypothetical protein R3F62_31385 [Planctomycetota bacterium]